MYIEINEFFKQLSEGYLLKEDNLEGTLKWLRDHDYTIANGPDRNLPTAESLSRDIMLYDTYCEDGELKCKIYVKQEFFDMMISHMKMTHYIEGVKNNVK